MSTTLEGEVVTVVYHNADSHYCVARVRSSSQPGLVTVVGTMGQLAPGERVSLTGNWQDHPRFGRQFQVESCSQSMPATAHGIQRYLASGMVRGIGPALAERLMDRFGTSVLDVLEQSPERLTEIEGIGARKLERIRSSWEEQREIRSLILFLQSHDVPPTFAGRIFRKYGRQAVQKLKENPYDLAFEIRGIGFKTADQMALRLGFSQEDPRRTEAAVVFALFQHAEHGHIFCPRQELQEKVASVLGGSGGERDLEAALRRLSEQKKVLLEPLPDGQGQQAVYLRHFHRLEREIAERLRGLIEHPSGIAEDKLERTLEELAQSSEISLSEEQLGAIYRACRSKVYILTGGPGTGKTTITNFIVRGLRRLGLKVKLAAPTGRASKKLSEATGEASSTIHRLLGYDPSGDFAYNQDRKLKTDALIVDETSMLDCQLCAHLLRALPLTSRLILVGDANQLPSVGPGNVLQDLLQSGAVPFSELSHIYRQARESMVVVNAHRINEGVFPVQSDKEPPQADFFWVEREDPEKVRDLIVHMVCDRIPAIYGLDPRREIQVLTPMHKGQAGTTELNRILQQRLNPNGPGVQSGGRVFRRGDRVLQMRNNYEKGVFNGDLGLVERADPEEGELTVDFDGERARYEQNELDELSLAYCISIHKAQGSEYPAAVVPILTQHYLLLQRNLIYTALTRAKRLAVMIGSKKAMAMGIKSSGKGRRYTCLRHRVRESFGLEAN
jgi:exodeoxyribonuclease V alpha subunit